jgi:hypothetical protein
MLTEDAVRDRRKTVTRRLGWWEDRHGRRLILPAQRLTLVRKAMGRKPGEELVRLAEVEVVDVRRERLWDITDDDVVREGVDPSLFDERYTDTGQPTPQAWVRWFCDEMDVDPDRVVTRIEWRYLDAEAGVR